MVLGLGSLLAALLLVGGVLVWRGGVAAAQPWFAGYVDVTVTPSNAFQKPMEATTKNVFLSFIVADPANPCAPHWGPHYSLDEAGASLSLDANVAELRRKGGHAGISFGGAANSELATTCTDLPSLEDAYRTVIDRYKVATVDFDIEGHNLQDAAAGARRAQALSTVQKEFGARGKDLEVWLTLPVSPRGLTDEGVAAIEQMLNAGVDLAGVNIMTMNYGDSRPPGQSILDASQAAALAAHSQLGIIYQRTGQELDSAAIWAKIGLTPMIGVNEIATDVFDLESARLFAEFAVAKKVGRMSMWSNNRDVECSTAAAGSPAASHLCSGVAQAAGAFGMALGGQFTGKLK